MAATVTILTDHKGTQRPRVNGDEYMVDAVIDVTSYTTNGETINATDVGLATIHQVAICGTEKPSTYQPYIEISAAGAYESSTSFQIFLTNNDGSNGQTSASADNTIRVRVWGLI